MSNKAKFPLLAVLLWISLAGCSINISEDSDSESFEYKVVNSATLAEISNMDDMFKNSFLNSGAAEPDDDLVTAMRKNAENINKIVTANLNQLGSEGWELVAIDKDSNYVFKREKE